LYSHSCQQLAAGRCGALPGDSSGCTVYPLNCWYDSLVCEKACFLLTISIPISTEKCVILCWFNRHPCPVLSVRPLNVNYILQIIFVLFSTNLTHRDFQYSSSKSHNHFSLLILFRKVRPFLKHCVQHFVMCLFLRLAAINLKTTSIKLSYCLNCLMECYLMTIHQLQSIFSVEWYETMN
jgi:hypothetical protein